MFRDRRNSSEWRNATKRAVKINLSSRVQNSYSIQFHSIPFHPNPSHYHLSSKSKCHLSRSFQQAQVERKVLWEGNLSLEGELCREYSAIVTRTDQYLKPWDLLGTGVNRSPGTKSQRNESSSFFSAQWTTILWLSFLFSWFHTDVRALGGKRRKENWAQKTGQCLVLLHPQWNTHPSVPSASKNLSVLGIFTSPQGTSLPQQEGKEGWRCGNSWFEGMEVSGGCCLRPAGSVRLHLRSQCALWSLHHSTAQ